MAARPSTWAPGKVRVCVSFVYARACAVACALWEPQGGVAHRGSMHMHPLSSPTAHVMLLAGSSVLEMIRAFETASGKEVKHKVGAWRRRLLRGLMHAHACAPPRFGVYGHVSCALSAHAPAWAPAAVATHALALCMPCARHVLAQCYACTRTVPCAMHVRVQVVDRRPGDSTAVWADTTLAQKELGWAAKHSVQDMCTHQWQWASKYPQGYETKA